MTFNKQRLIEVMKQNDIYDTLEFVVCKTIPDCLDLCCRIKRKNGDFIRLRRLSFRHEERVLAEYARKTSRVGKMVECAIAASDSSDVVGASDYCIKIRLANEAIFKFIYNEALETYASSILYEGNGIQFSMSNECEDDLLEATYHAAELIDSANKMIQCSSDNRTRVTDLVNERLKELNCKSDNDSSYIGSVVKELADKYDKGDD